jgi:hypothetical protein
MTVVRAFHLNIMLIIVMIICKVSLILGTLILSTILSKSVHYMIMVHIGLRIGFFWFIYID